MSTWVPELDLEPGARLPLFQQIAEAVILAARAGRLRPGDRLPASRGLAQRLGVHRSTTVSAYDELAAQGWVESRRGSGTYVARDLPDASGTATPPRSDPGRRTAVYPVPRRPRPEIGGAVPGVLHLAGGRPDVRLVPTAEIARAWRRRMRAQRGALLDYGDPRGDARLRRALLDMLAATRGVVAGPSEILITRGAQMALHLGATTLLGRGDRVAVEALGYPPAWVALASSGAALVDVPLDERGLDVDVLERQVSADPSVRAVYVTPHHQFPTMAVLSAGRRLNLLEMARRHRLVVFEDDYDHEFHYEGRPVLPLAARDAERSVVFYIGTLSKVLAPGLRVGFVVAPAEVIDELVARRVTIDRQGDLAMESALADLFEDGIVQRHLRRMRRVYAQRRSALAAALERELRGALSFSLPTGGMALWARVADGIDVAAWAERALARGVLFRPGAGYLRAEGGLPYIRLGFAALAPDEIDEAVSRMAAAL